MYYITGDTHGDFNRIASFSKAANTTLEDTMIILGDAGINFYGEDVDKLKKEQISKIPLTLFCIHGNHEMRPSTISTYKMTEWHGGTVWFEEKYPNILFAKDGEVYDLAGKKCVVIGGAYSVDKSYRLAHGWPWFADEQPSEEIKVQIEDKLNKLEWKIDIVLSHTVPFEYMPIDLFLEGIDQSKVDNSTEHWLSSIELRLNYKWWYAGHFHTHRTTEKIQIMFQNIERFGMNI